MEKKGSALIIALTFGVLMLGGIASLIKLQSLNHKINHRSFEGNKALYIAESGIHLALHELNYNPVAASRFTSSPFFTWTNKGSGIYSLTRTDIGNGILYVEADYSNPNIITITSKGVYQDVTKKLQVKSIKGPTSTLNSTFPGAIAALSEVVIMSSFIADSYSGGTYNPASPGYRGDILSRGNSVDLKNGVIIRGHCYALPGPSTFSVAPPDTSRGVIFWSSVDEASLIYRPGEQENFNEFTPITVPAHLLMTGTKDGTLTGGGIYPGGYYNGTAGKGNSITFTGGFYKIAGDLLFNNNKDMIITGPCDIYVTGDFDVGGNIINYDTVSGQVFQLRIFVDGYIAFKQGADVNTLANYTASTFQLYGTGPGKDASPADRISFNNSTDFIGTIYAPEYEVEFASGSQVFGAFAVYKIIPKAGSQIHFDERLLGDPDGTNPKQYGIDAWKII